MGGLSLAGSSSAADDSQAFRSRTPSRNLPLETLAGAAQLVGLARFSQELPRTCWSRQYRAHRLCRAWPALTLTCPVTRGGTFAHGRAWTVALTAAGLQTVGVLLCNPARTVDWKARRALFIQAVLAELVADVLARAATLIE